MADLFIRTETPTSNGDSWITHTESPAELPEELLLQSLRDSVSWYLERQGVTAVGDTEYVVIELGLPPRVTARGTL